MRVVTFTLILMSFSASAISQESRGEKDGGQPIGYRGQLEKIAMQGFYFGVDTIYTLYSQTGSYAIKLTAYGCSSNTHSVSILISPQ